MADENPKSDQTQPRPATKNLAPAEAAELMSVTALNLRRQWLQAAISVANILKNGRTVNRGTFEDLKRVRENFEELERARIVLQKLNPADGAEPGAAEKN